MKQLFYSFLSLMILGIALGAALLGWGVHQYTAQGSLTEEKLVMVERGTGVSSIADLLAQENIISQPTLFKVIGRFGHTLKAGEYLFPANISMAEVISMMEEGEVYDRKITIVEGLTSHQIVKRLNERDDLSGKINNIPPEGTMLPETYHYIMGQDRNEIISIMQRDQDVIFKKYWTGRDDDLPFDTIEEAIILASIVEKETGVGGERSKVAGVFINRLRQGMPLQTDPTVIYALTKGDIKEDGRGPLGRRLLRKDLKFSSPYNTYLNAGLPPGPIANPGIKAFDAVINPAEHDYFYFVADGTGGHSFGKTLAEHNRNVAAWRKIR